MDSTRRVRRETIEIAGRAFTIQTDQPGARLAEICAYVNAKFDTLATSSGLSFQKQAFLVILSLCEELFQERGRHRTEVGEMADRARNLLAKLAPDHAEQAEG